MKDLLIDESKWPLSDLSKSERIADLTEALAFGNHKGASQKPVRLKKVISDTSVTATDWSFHEEKSHVSQMHA